MQRLVRCLYLCVHVRGNMWCVHVRGMPHSTRGCNMQRLVRCLYLCVHAGVDCTDRAIGTELSAICRTARGSVICNG